MAKQKGIVKLKGSIGDLSFYKTKDGYLAREKTVIDKKRIASDPAFQRTRENGQEFGNAGRAGRILRTALRQYLQVSSDSRVTSRLTTELLRILKTDSVNDRGMRQVHEGDLTLLTGFDFNVGGRLGSTLFSPYDMSIDRVEGKAVVSLEDFIPNRDVVFPQGTSHMRLMAGITAIDFPTEQTYFKGLKSKDIVLGPQNEAPMNLEMDFPANTENDLFLVLGVEFVQDVNGKQYPLKNGAYNALSIIAVSQQE